jgi:hypothetical protein
MQSVASENFNETDSNHNENETPISDDSNKLFKLSEDVKRQQSLLKALLKSFGAEFLMLGFLKLLNDSLNFSGPLLLNQLVQFVGI